MLRRNEAPDGGGNAVVDRAADHNVPGVTSVPVLLPVAFYGVGGFLAILTVSIAGLQPKFAATRGPTKLLVVLGGVGAAFTGYLTYIEAFVLQAWCRWCVVSALLIVCVFAVALVGLKERPPDTSH